MKRSPLLFTALLIGCSTAGAHESAPAAASELAADELQQINGIFERWQSAWNTHDMHAFAQLFQEPLQIVPEEWFRCLNSSLYATVMRATVGRLPRCVQL